MNPLFHEIFQTTRDITNKLNSCLKEHDLYSSQWTILYTINKNGPMSLTDIWKYLKVEAPTVTRTVARLEQLDWIVRTEGEDRREKIVSFSEEGNKKFPAVLASVLQFEEGLIETFNDEEQQQLLELICKLKGRANHWKS
ncbi:MarR family winged helix-turn-helix transcriptional regulator [Viridibacillus arvi]|uniref:MarR family winged helix-turn-helix transcriptional regulator n=1 Tax=Viridibacillus arvi TaxID=263475 RepID=UPI003CFE8371